MRRLWTVPTEKETSKGQARRDFFPALGIPTTGLPSKSFRTSCLFLHACARHVPACTSGQIPTVTGFVKPLAQRVLVQWRLLNASPFLDRQYPLSARFHPPPDVFQIRRLSPDETATDPISAVRNFLAATYVETRTSFCLAIRNSGGFCQTPLLKQNQSFAHDVPAD